MRLPIPLLLLPLLSALPALAQQFNGTGNIWVLRGYDVQKANPVADRIGCLNNGGRFISDSVSCGVFHFPGHSGDNITTTAGKCSFLDRSSEEGQGRYAFKCGPGPRAGEEEAFYSFDQFPGLIWTGNLNNSYRVKKIPGKGENVGVFTFWGAPDGYDERVLLYWNKLS